MSKTSPKEMTPEQIEKFGGMKHFQERLQAKLKQLDPEMLKGMLGGMLSSGPDDFFLSSLKALESVTKKSAGSTVTVELFEAGQRVDVQGTTIGRGFAGVMRRHGFAGGRATHGNSKAHRKPGSIGQNQDPGRVFKGKKMAGHMGNAVRTQQNLEIHQVDPERNLILIRGAVPGPRGRDVLIQSSVKSRVASEK